MSQKNFQLFFIKFRISGPKYPLNQVFEPLEGHAQKLKNLSTLIIKALNQAAHYEQERQILERRYEIQRELRGRAFEQKRPIDAKILAQ